MDGGPAGMMAAITAAKEGNQVILLEKNQELGKKLLITGKGRCNITSSLPIEDFIPNIPGNGMFLYSAFKKFDNKDIIQFLEERGVKTKIERGNRIFPVSDTAKEVRDAFLEELKKQKVEIRTNCRVEKILAENGKIKGLKTDYETISADKVIIATGGKSYPLTGSTGDGYQLAKTLGHTIIPIRGSLVPLEVYDKKFVLSLQGLSLKNVAIKIEDREKKKIIYTDFGEMLFTHFGVSGPIILSSSSHLLRYSHIETLMQNHKIQLHIDLKPALTEEILEKRILRDFDEAKNKELKNGIKKLLPQKMILPMINKWNLLENKKINEITKEERKKMVNSIKNLTLEIQKFRPVEEAIITAGGISIKEIIPNTMESKIVKGLFFAGELIDVDAYTGGFNLQIAYSTGYVAGKNTEGKE